MHIGRKIITITSKKIIYMFNASQLYSIPQNKTVFLEVNYNDRAFSTMKKKKRDPRFFNHNPTITFPAGHYIKNTNIVSKKVDQSLVFAAIRKCHLLA